jgi:hypothetical protein
VAETEIPEHLVAKPLCTAAEAALRLPINPPKPGYYAIFIDDPHSLHPSPFEKILLQKMTRLIYIGIATKSLFQRLVKQDLRHEGGRSTFFRAVGPILEYWPLPGSLAGMKNQNNYRFSPGDTAKIVSWINKHLLVSWVEANPALPKVEQALIRTYCPVINTHHNPQAVPELADLRHQCRIIARVR